MWHILWLLYIQLKVLHITTIQNSLAARAEGNMLQISFITEFPLKSLNYAYLLLLILLFYACTWSLVILLLIYILVQVHSAHNKNTEFWLLQISYVHSLRTENSIRVKSFIRVYWSCVECPKRSNIHNISKCQHNFGILVLNIILAPLLAACCEANQKQ